MRPEVDEAIGDLIELVRLCGPFTITEVVSRLNRWHFREVLHAAVRVATERGWLRFNDQMKLEYRNSGAPMSQHEISALKQELRATRTRVLHLEERIQHLEDRGTPRGQTCDHRGNCFVQPDDETFEERRGCLDCNQWLEPVRLKAHPINSFDLNLVEDGHDDDSDLWMIDEAVHGQE